MSQLGAIPSDLACAALGRASEGLAQEAGETVRGRMLAERDCAARHTTGHAHGPGSRQRGPGGLSLQAEGRDRRDVIDRLARVVPPLVGGRTDR